MAYVPEVRTRKQTEDLEEDPLADRFKSMTSSEESHSSDPDEEDVDATDSYLNTLTSDEECKEFDFNRTKKVEVEKVNENYSLFAKPTFQFEDKMINQFLHKNGNSKNVDQDID